MRVKECDRLAVMASQLTRLGARLEEQGDGLTIYGETTLQGNQVDSHGDHRIAMSLAIAALRATGSTHIDNADAATISYPSFIPTLAQLCHLPISSYSSSQPG
jgi:3-phosphoshikimate 1-carboxyvinyltransferase